jgi:hypothetical protein
MQLKNIRTCSLSKLALDRLMQGERHVREEVIPLRAAEPFAEFGRRQRHRVHELRHHRAHFVDEPLAEFFVTPGVVLRETRNGFGSVLDTAVDGQRLAVSEHLGVLHLGIDVGEAVIVQLEIGQDRPLADEMIGGVRVVLEARRDEFAGGAATAHRIVALDDCDLQTGLC